MVIYPTDKLNKQFKANRGVLGKVYKKDANKYAQLIESGNVSWDGCTSEFYTFDYVIEQSDKHMVGTKFNYVDSSDKVKQSVVYLNTQSNHQTDMEAEINNIRRQVNGLRKDMGLKMFNKVEVVFEQNEYWNNLNQELMDLLVSRLVADIRFKEYLDDFKVIETFNGKEIKVSINVI